MHELFRLLLSFCIFVIQPCLAFTLVTSEEAIKEAKNSKDYILKLGENNTLPSIKLVHPNVLSEFITSPLSIELAFKKKDVPILPETFQAFYGSMRLNITKGILREAMIDKNFLKVDNAKIPSGKHTFFVQIADTNGRVAKRMFKIKVR